MATCSKRRRAPRPAADLVISLPDLLAGRRRHVLRRLRPLCRRRRAGLDDQDRILDRQPKISQFLSLTFVGMTAGALITGFVGDKFGRRFTYQINLLIFGLASLAAAFAQDMNQLIVCRFVQGLGLGAEIVVGYSTHDRIRSAEDARTLAVDDGLHRGRRLSGDLAARLSRHPEFRMAADVRHRRHRLADRLVSAQEPAGIAALA